MLFMGGIVLLREWETLDGMGWIAMTTLVFGGGAGLLSSLYSIANKFLLLEISNEGIVDHRLISKLRGNTFIPWMDIVSVSKLYLPYGQRALSLKLRSGKSKSIPLIGFGVSPEEIERTVLQRGQ